MLKYYLKQTWHSLKEHKLLSLVSIIGTGLSIAMIMVIIIIWQVRVAPCEPEINRDRTLCFDLISVGGKNMGINYASLSPCFIQECLYPLKNAEKVSMVGFRDQNLASVPALKKELVCDVLQTDEAFFDIFHLEFLSGRRFSKDEVKNGTQVGIITESVARNLFQTADVCGRTVEIMNSEMKIIGVVKDVSTLATNAYAQIWLPWSFANNDEPWTEPWGGMRAFILVNPKQDIAELRKEIDDNIRKFSLLHKEHNLHEIISTAGRPVTGFEMLFRDKSLPEGGIFNTQKNVVPDTAKAVSRWGIVILILLIVPAVNLSGLITSRMNERMNEIGIRKAFGADRIQLVKQVLTENMVATFLGGILGLLLSYISVWILKEWLLDPSVDFIMGENKLNADMVLHPVIFISTFLFCLLLNLLSAGIPAWIAAKSDIIKSLNGKL